mgnify:CR=1 FL=1
MALEASLARNRIAAAISSGWAPRFLRVKVIPLGPRSGPAQLEFHLGL